jgi:hypothetical protein
MRGVDLDPFSDAHGADVVDAPRAVPALRGGERNAKVTPVRCVHGAPDSGGVVCSRGYCKAAPLPCVCVCLCARGARARGV